MMERCGCSVLRAPSDVSCSPLSLSCKKKRWQFVILVDVTWTKSCPVSWHHRSQGLELRQGNTKVTSPRGMRRCPSTTLSAPLGVSAAPEDQGMPLNGKKERRFQVRSQGQGLFLPFSGNKGSGTALCSLGDFLLSTFIYKSVESTFLIKLLITRVRMGGAS